MAALMCGLYFVLLDKQLNKVLFCERKRGFYEMGRKKV